jgi:hypothetical protein
MRDLHHNIKTPHLIAPQSLGATGGGGITGRPVSRKGFESVELVALYGNVTATGATVTAKVLHGDTSGALTTAGASNLLGTAGAGLAAAAARVSKVSKNVAARVGYIGPKEWVTLKLIPTVSGGINASALAVLGHAHDHPTTSL